MITPDASAANPGASKSTGGRDFCVPLKALSIDGTPPAVGDEVDFTAKGKVARVEGEHAYVTPSEVNGEPFSAPAEKPEAAEPDDDDMMRIAEEADKKNA